LKVDKNPEKAEPVNYDIDMPGMDEYLEENRKFQEIKNKIASKFNAETDKPKPAAN
tara:strand:- start:14004 stop:14171 length:168 start_codon:yes stop_codon:yes gene_type:complete